MKEIKVGERLTITLEVVEQKGCNGCFFFMIESIGILRLLMNAWKVFSVPQDTVLTVKM